MRFNGCQECRWGRKNTHLQHPELRHLADESQTAFVIWSVPDVSFHDWFRLSVFVFPVVASVFWWSICFGWPANTPGDFRLQTNYTVGPGTEARIPGVALVTPVPPWAHPNIHYIRGKLLTVQCCDQSTMNIMYTQCILHCGLFYFLHQYCAGPRILCT